MNPLSSCDRCGVPDACYSAVYAFMPLPVFLCGECADIERFAFASSQIEMGRTVGGILGQTVERTNRTNYTNWCLAVGRVGPALVPLEA